MSTAVAELAKQGATIAYVLEIEGVDAVFCTGDPAGIATAWAGSGYSVFRRGLRTPGSISRSLNLMTFEVQQTSLTFEIADADKATLADLFADNVTGMCRTQLTADLDRDDTTILVQSTTGFPASGTIYIGHERITYTGTANGFTGCTRGTLGFAGKATWAHSQELGEATLGAEVTDRPTVWTGRGVCLYIVAKDPSTGTWTTRANSVLDFVGVLSDQPWAFGDDGVYRLEADSIEKLLSTKLMPMQFTATIADIILPVDETIRLFEREVSTAFIADRLSTIVVPAGTYTLDSLLGKINELFIDARAYAGTPILHHWNVKIYKTAAGWRCTLEITTDPSIVQASTLHAYMDFYYSTSQALRTILGLEEAYATIVTGASGSGAVQTHHSQFFPRTPKAIYIDGRGGSVTLTARSGTFFNATELDIDAGLWANGARGFVLLGEDTIWLVSYNSGTGVLKKYAEWSTNYGMVVGMQNGGSWMLGGVRPIFVDYGSDTKPNLSIKQIWIAQGTVGDLLLRMLLSTGTYQYNDSTHDVWPAHMACGLPSTVVDIGSIQAMTAAVGEASRQTLIVFKTTDALAEINSFLASVGFHLCWHSGKLRAIHPTTIDSLPTDWELDASTMGPDGPSVDLAADLVQNSVSLKLNRDPFTDEFTGRVETFVDLTSQRIYGPRGDICYEARSLYDSGSGEVRDAWRRNVAASMCAYFSRAMRRYRLSGAPSLYGLSVGDIVSITSTRPPDATTGTYGVEEVRAWVTGFSFDYSTHEFSLTLLSPPARAYQLAPSGLLDYEQVDYGYHASGGHPHIVLRDHQYTNATEAVDASFFAVGDTVIVTETDPDDPDDPLQWTRKITAINGSEIELDGSPFAAPYDDFDTSKKYVVELGLFTDVVDAQYGDEGYEGMNRPERAPGGSLAYSALADEDGSLGIVAATQFGTFRPRDTEAASAPDGLTKWRRPWTGKFDEGRPFSVAMVHEFAEAVNNCYLWTSIPQLLSEVFVTRPTVTGDAYQIIYGPMLLVLPSGCAKVGVFLMGSTSNASYAASFRTVLSSRPPTKVGDFGMSGIVGSNEEAAWAVNGFSSTSDSYKPAFVGYPRRLADGRCWLTIEACTTDPAQTARLKAITIRSGGRLF